MAPSAPLRCTLQIRVRAGNLPHRWVEWVEDVDDDWHDIKTKSSVFALPHSAIIDCVAPTAVH